VPAFYFVRRTVRRYTISRFTFRGTRHWKSMGKKNIEYIPEFHKSFRHPRYWGAWLGVAAIAGIALTPAAFRDPILAKLGRLAGRLGKAPVAEH
jgi:lauroyl-KDO2-lipid IV(A) myristoyltransferase